MKRIYLLSFVLTSLLFFGSPVFAFNFQYYNFGSDPFTGDNNISPACYPNGIGYQPSPGSNPNWEGGEKFDYEGLFAQASTEYIHVAITSSFGDLAHSISEPHTFRDRHCGPRRSRQISQKEKMKFPPRGRCSLLTP